MQRDYEKSYHDLEEHLWWFRARRELILALLQPFPRESHILEIGCSGGELLRDLARAGFSQTEGIDISPEAIAKARARGASQVREARGEATGAADASVDILIAADILEHIENEEAAVREWHRILKPGGTLIVMVPAFMALWSGHDLVNEHKRRYRKHRLNQVLAAGGFTIARSSYWNFTLFFPTLAVRLLPRLVGRKPQPKAQLFALPRPLNALLLLLLRAENALLRAGLRFPFGVSVLTYAHKKKIA